MMLFWEMVAVWFMNGVLCMAIVCVVLFICGIVLAVDERKTRMYEEEDDETDRC